MKVVVMVIGLLVSAAIVQAATVYRSVGPDGQVIYSDKPPADVKSTKKLDFTDLPATPLPPAVLKYQAELQKSMQQRLGDGASPAAGATVLFTAKWCGYCTRAKAYLAEMRIPFQEHDIDTPEGMRAYVAAGASRGVPVLLYKGAKVNGFSRPAYEALFASAR